MESMRSLPGDEPVLIQFTMHTLKMITEIVEAGPFFLAFGAAWSKAALYLDGAVKRQDLVHAELVALKVVDRCETFARAGAFHHVALECVVMAGLVLSTRSC